LNGSGCSRCDGIHEWPHGDGTPVRLRLAAHLDIVVVVRHVAVFAGQEGRHGRASLSYVADFLNMSDNVLCW